MVFEQFPYSNYHDLNLDWILQALQTLETSVKDFISINAIKYANPILWNITSQYEKNTVVLDISGNAYLSVQAVPGGISIDRTDFWTVIGNFSSLWDNVKQAITTKDEGHSDTASASRVDTDLVWVDGDLLEVTSAMTAGDRYVTGGNCRIVSMEVLLKEIYGNIYGETQARQNADTALQSAIDAEETARQSADTVLQGAITSEATARQSADTELQGAIDRVFKRKILFIGDSYGLAPDAEINWVKHCADAMGLVIGESAFNGSVSGIGFAAGGEAINGFLTALTNASVGDRSKITDVVIAGGFNDANTNPIDLTKIDTGIRATAAYAKTNYPNAKLWLGFVGYGEYASIAAPNFNNIDYLNALWTYQRNASLCGFTWLKDCEYVMHMWYLLGTDGIHPTSEGAYRIGGAVACALTGGGYTQLSIGDRMKLKATVGDIGGVTTDVYNGVTYSTGELCWWNMEELAMTLPNTSIGNDFVEIASAETQVFYCNTPIDIHINAVAVSDIESPIFTNVPMTMRLFKGKLYLRSDYIHSGSFETHIFTVLRIKSQMITFPNLC